MPTIKKTLRGLRISGPLPPGPGPGPGAGASPEGGAASVIATHPTKTRQWMCTWAEINTSPAIATNSTVRYVME